jgi:hypothetical protein
MGMFWAGPRKWIATDRKNIEFAESKGAPGKPNNAVEYLKWLEQVRKVINGDGVEFSRQAHLWDVEKRLEPPIVGSKGNGTAPGYWKIAPGKQADQWEQCRTGNFTSIGWARLGDLTDLDRKGFVALMASASTEFGFKKAGMEQVWKFREIPVGSRIVANRGTRAVLGIGTVTGSYYYEPGQSLPHRLPVRWDDTQERKVEKPGWFKSLIKLTQKQFEELLLPPKASELPESSEDARTAIPDELLDFDAIMAELAQRGLQFPSELVATYLLALQAKRFVILSGISGTGKTQLALGIAKALEGRLEEEDQDGGEEEHRIHCRPYMSKRSRLVLPAAIVRQLEGSTSLEKNKLKVSFPGAKSPVELRLYRGTTAMRLIFGDEFRRWFKTAYQVGADLLLSLDLSEDEPVLTVRQDQQRASTSKPRGAYEVVAVRPDWTDNRGLLGYYNPITKEYQSTPFLRLLLKARQEADHAQRDRRAARPFFVVLDEMNLARVEHYFSDFLSCLESGEMLHLHDDPNLLDEGASATGETVPMRLGIPSNLFFTGTINVDETTYMFSPKVLDRAFTLEFNEVNLSSFGTEQQEEAGDGDEEFALSQFSGMLDVSGPPSMDDWKKMQELLNGDLRSALINLNARLQRDNRHFGYRVANEIARFVCLAERQAGPEAPELWTAFDLAVLAKVLPKLHGTQQEIEETLRSLFSFAIGLIATDGKTAEAEWDLKAGRLELKEQKVGTSLEPKLPRTAAKLWRMLRRLREQGFASFVE